MVDALRVCVHALDRTGPPLLALSFLRWFRAARPDVRVDVIAFRGGELWDDYVQLCPTRVVLDPHEPWDSGRYSSSRAGVLRDRLASVPEVDVTLLVSVAAGQALPLLPDARSLVTWVVEQGEDLHWIDAPIGLVDRTTRWVAGSEGTRVDLGSRLADGVRIDVAPEFVDMPDRPSEAVVQHCRASLDVHGDERLVVGAGIGTRRKGPDLFVETALEVLRTSDRPARFVWFGGQSDPLFEPLRAEAARPGDDHVRLVGNVTEVVPWIAAADVFLHPARLDAFPLVCLHAASQEVPVVAFADAGGVPEMLGESFVGVPFPDVAGLASCVVDLFDAGRRGVVASAQSRHVRQHFDVRSCAPQLASVLDEVST